MKLKFSFVFTALILTCAIFVILSSCQLFNHSPNSTPNSPSVDSSGFSSSTDVYTNTSPFWADDSANWVGEVYFWGYPVVPDSLSNKTLAKTGTISGSLSQMKALVLSSQQYTVDPIFNPVEGTYSVPKTIQIKSTTTGAVIHYTTNGTIPTASSPVLGTLALSNGTVTVQAIAVTSGMGDSRVIKATYYFQPAPSPGNAGEPGFSPVAGFYNTNISVQLKSQTSGATVRYTTNGSTPTATSKAYSAAIPISAGTMVIKAIAIKSGLTNSAIITQSFTVTGVVCDPVFTLIDNINGKYISIDCASSGASIYYTLDGSTPNMLSTLYYEVFTLPGTNIISARAYISNWTTSHMAVYAYSTAGKTANPIFSVPGGSYAAPFNLSFSCPTAGSAILWSIDSGNTWNSSQSNTVFISSNTTVMAKAVRTGYNDSDTVTNSYIISAYTVTYYTNGATGGNAPTDGNKYLLGASVTVLGNNGGMVNPGYYFAGWNTKADGTGTSFAGGSIFTMGSANVNLYAVWSQKHVYNVIYIANGATGGSVPSDNNNYLQGATVTISYNAGNLVRTGYTFIGWNTKADGTGSAFAGGSTFTMGSANVNLYAVWTQNPTYTVTYVATGTSGSAPTDGNNYIQGASVTVLGNNGGMVNPGYYFAGWNTKADGTGTAYTGGSIFTMGSSGITFYAIWTQKHVYNVIYIANGATSGGVPNDNNNYLAGATVTSLGNINGLVRTGYSFAGWNTKADGTGTGYAGGATFTMGSANVNLYAVWTQNPTYTVTYIATGSGGSAPTDGNNYIPGLSVTVLGNNGGMVNPGYSFAGWNTKADGTGTSYSGGATFMIGLGQCHSLRGLDSKSHIYCYFHR